MKRILGLVLVLVIGCWTMGLPMVVAASDVMDKGLPEVYINPESTTVTAHKTYTEETRPAHGPAVNAVLDNPKYGNELNFLTITNLATGEAWRAGTVELVAGSQYRVEVYCRNDDASTTYGERYEDVRVSIEMPYQLGAGEFQQLWTKIVADNIVEVRASIELTARTGVSVQYVDYSSKVTGDDGDSIVDYRELFQSGANIVPRHQRLDPGEYRKLSFDIIAVADPSIPVVNPMVDYSLAVSQPGTGFPVMPVEDKAVVVTAPPTEEPEATELEAPGYYKVLFPVLGSVVLILFACMIIKKYRDDHGGHF